MMETLTSSTLLWQPAAMGKAGILAFDIEVVSGRRICFTYLPHSRLEDVAARNRINPVS